MTKVLYIAIKSGASKSPSFKFRSSNGARFRVTAARHVKVDIIFYVHTCAEWPGAYAYMHMHTHDSQAYTHTHTHTCAHTSALRTHKHIGTQIRTCIQTDTDTDYTQTQMQTYKWIGIQIKKFDTTIPDKREASANVNLCVSTHARNLHQYRRVTRLFTKKDWHFSGNLGILQLQVLAVSARLLLNYFFFTHVSQSCSQSVSRALDLALSLGSPFSILPLELLVSLLMYVAVCPSPVPSTAGMA